MAGRPIKAYTGIYFPISWIMDDGTNISSGDILILCPICRTHYIGTYGTQSLKTGMWPKFQCKNPFCPALEYLRKGKQFTIQTSALFQDALQKHLNQILIPLLRGDTTQEALGTHFHRSPALMTYIRHKVENLLEERKELEKLLIETPMKNAVALDEMFLKIAGEAVYVIMATCYQSNKILGIKVSSSRDEHLMREVFDEAEGNNGKPFSCLTIDAWGGSMRMAKNLRRPISVVIHKFKSPYIKAVLWKIEYDENKQIIHQIGIKTDFFKTRHT